MTRLILLQCSRFKTLWQQYGNIVARSWHEHGKILQEFTGFLKGHGKILAKSWQDLTGFFERSWQDRGKILQRFCKNVQDFLKDHGKITPTPCRI